MDIIPKKLRTVVRLINERAGKEILQTVIRYIVRVTKYRMDELDVNAYVLGRFEAKIPIECIMAGDKDMQLLFDHWPDSRDEYERHHEVYYRWGFKRCFLFTHCDTGEIVHFQFLLTHDDRHKIRQYLPRQRYRFLSCNACAYQEWLYTFEKYRRLGISLQATDSLIKFCQDNGIKKLFSHRGASNIPSLCMAGKIGFASIATIYHIQFLAQHKHSGLYFMKLATKL